MIEVQVNLNVNGALESDAFRALTPYMQAQVMRAGLKAGARVIARHARGFAPVRQNVPGKGGDLRDAIEVKAGPIRRDNKGKARVVCRVGPGFFKGDEYYAGFQEFGWRQGSRRPKSLVEAARRRAIEDKGGNGRRFIEPKTAHYMERAANSPGVEAAIQEGIIKEMDT